MNRFFQAEYIFPISSPPLKNGIVELAEDNSIAAIHTSRNTVNEGEVHKLKGILVPGFINSHCHLELSHMKDRIARNTGLLPFLRTVINSRSSPEEEVSEAIRAWDLIMRENGIVAVGDISNTSLTRESKLSSDIHYHTFVELIGFNPDKAKEIYNRGLVLLQDFAPLSASFSAHAPYSVSEVLFKLLSSYNSSHTMPTAMHSQESMDEDLFFAKKEGGFLEFYSQLGLDIGFFNPTGKSAIETIGSSFEKKLKILLVHNTYSSAADLKLLSSGNEGVYWCFCPKANLYIEGRLPAIDLFIKYDSQIMIGTDSLASNDTLCILSEIQAIKAHYPQIKSEQLIRWATLNGARFFGIEDSFGSLEIGKKPGLNLITATDGREITEESEIMVIV